MHRHVDINSTDRCEVWRLILGESSLNYDEYFTPKIDIFFCFEFFSSSQKLCVLSCWFSFFPFWIYALFFALPRQHTIEEAKKIQVKLFKRQRPLMSKTRLYTHVCVYVYSFISLLFVMNYLNIIMTSALSHPSVRV